MISIQKGTIPQNCRLCNGSYICLKFHENIFDSFKVLEMAQFSFKILLRRRTVKMMKWSYGSFTLHIVC